MATGVQEEVVGPDPRRVGRFLIVMGGLLAAGVLVAPCAVIGTVALWEQLGWMPLVAL